jgi:DNA polymerase-3 subunit beta
MDLTIDRAPALSAISRVVGIVERRHTIPILANVALSAADGRLSLRATDLEMEAIESLDAQVKDQGEITLPADKLHDIVRNAEPGAEISMGVDDTDPRMKVKSGRSRFNVPVMPASSFPTFPKDALGEPFAMPAKLLADMISRVIWASDSSDKVSARGCVYLGAKGDELHAVATNTKVIAKRSEPKPDGADLSVILPAKLANYLVKWLGELDGDAQISTSESLIQVRQGEAILTAKLFDVPGYYQYDRFLKTSHELAAATDQDALNAALRRVLIMSQDRIRTVRMTFAAGQVAIMVRGEGDGADEIACDYDGPETSIMLNGAQLQAALAAMKGDRVEFSFSAKDQLVVMSAPADPSFIANAAQMRA